MNHKRYCLLVGVLVCCLNACSDDSQGTAEQSKCQCEADQVCGQNGVCYDDARCAECSAEEVCVGGVCYASDSKCAACDSNQVCVGEVCYAKDSKCAACSSDQVCVGEVCYAKDSECAKCKSDQVCVSDVCYDKTSKCAKCSADQVCVGEVCYDSDSKCAKCKPEQVCKDDICYNAEDPCLKCSKSQTCIDGNCISPDDKCKAECSEPDYCYEGECHTCENVCEGKCCSDGEACDPILKTCGTACPNDGETLCGDNCCSADEECDESYGCVPVCVDGVSTRCEGSGGVACCDDTTEECINGACTAKCGGVRCGETQELCCEGETPVCESNVCKIECGNGTRCGDNDEFCCDNSSQVCLYKMCLKKGDACKGANDCGYDEFCEETTSTCVKVDADPNACVVKPLTGKFQPTLEWHWPKSLPGGAPSVHPAFDQVMNNPVVINLTDDNGDGKINEDDTPDLVFTTFAKGVDGSGYTGMNVLRAISGDDGHELATHPDIKFWLSRDPGAAKVNGDEYPEIVVRSKESDGQTYALILNLVPKDKGFEFKEVARLAVDGQFPRFANLDGGKEKFPQIVVNGGIIEYSEDTEGKGTYKVRCTAGFGAGHGGSTVADLDGDGEMEIVGSRIFDKNCQVISTDSVQGGTVLADLDPTSNDHANGRLDVEQIVMTGGGEGAVTDTVPPKGKIHAYKVFKRDGKFSRELLWEHDMPIDYAHAQDVMHNTGPNYKYSDGSQFVCDRKSAETFAYPDAEWWRRYMCSTGGGPLVVADFNRDRKPDVGLATGWSYVVYDGSGEIIWADFNTQDYSSKATGSSLFDFEGDGVAEVLYADELNLHVYKGPCSGNKDAKTGYCSADHLIEDIPNSSGTLIEYPLVVDVDNDYHSEIIVVSNDYAFPGVTGIRAYGDPDGHWVRTRRIWNQFDYHVTNINEDGTVPKKESQNWKMNNLNNFRQNVQPDGLFNAPNLVATGLVSDESACEKILKLVAKVENKGSLGVKPGVRVNFYIVVNVDGKERKVLLGEKTIGSALAPGASATVTLDWDQTVTVDGQKVEIKSPVMIYFVVDEPTAEKGNGDYLECIEDDNALSPQAIKLCEGVVY